MTEIIDIVEPYITGPQGAGGTIESATAVGLAPGADPTVTLGGTPEQRTIEFGIPEGEPGTPATITSATAETLPPQSAATVTVGGTPSARTFTFGIPKGDPGSGSVNSVNGDLGPDVVLGATDVGGSLAATQGTMPIRGAGGKLPGIGAPTAATDAATKKYVDDAVSPLATKEYVDGAISGHFPSADIKHVEASGYSYEVMRVRGGFGAIRKIQPKAVSSSGTATPAQLLTPKAMAAESGYRTLTNADACGGGATQRINGMHIIDGNAVQDFGVQSGPLIGSGLEALLLMRDGTLKAARASEGKTAAQYVAEGAYASFGYGPILVEGGVVRNWQSDPTFSGFATELSARTILGATSDGTYVIITVDGKTGSFGIAGDAMGVLAKNEGCHIAIVLDGGGTTQAMWNGNVIHPSADASGERTGMSFIAVAAPVANEYDSGIIPIPVRSAVTGVGGNVPLAVRQIGGQVSLLFAASVTIPVDSWVEVSSVGLPDRYQAETSSYNRGIIYGTSGAAIGVSKADGNHKINIRSRTPGLSGLNGAEGSVTYRAKHA